MDSAILLAATFGFALLACGADSGIRYVAATTHRLPAYTPAESALFDDSISPEIFGLAAGRVAPERDPKIIEGAQKADVVARAKVVTVTRDIVRGRPAYALRIRILGTPLSGMSTEEVQELRVSPENPAVVFIQASETAFIGQRLVVFLRTYNDKGEAVTHYRVEPESEAVRRAVGRALALDELGR